jgi:hypothetical protein
VPPVNPWTGEELAPVAGGAFAAAGKWRAFRLRGHVPEEWRNRVQGAWFLPPEVEKRVGDRMAAVANKHNLWTRFKEEIQLAAVVVLCFKGCVEAEMEVAMEFDKVRQAATRGTRPGDDAKPAEGVKIS